MKKTSNQHKMSRILKIEAIDNYTSSPIRLEYGGGNHSANIKNRVPNVKVSTGLHLEDMKERVPSIPSNTVSSNYLQHSAANKLYVTAEDIHKRSSDRFTK